MDFLAHIAEDGRKQTVEEHLKGTGEITSDCLKCLGFSNTGYLLGLVHDMGKATDNFREYIYDAVVNKLNVVRGSVNHTFAAVIFLWDRYHETDDRMRKLYCEMLCAAAGSHHGLIDCINPDGDSGFLHRIEYDREKIQYSQAVTYFLSDCTSDAEVDELFEKGFAEFKSFGCNNRITCSYLTRIFTSALAEGDRTNTASFNGVVQEKKPFAREIASAALMHLEKNLQCFARSPINAARQTFSDKCKSFASANNGVFRLNLPTGAGKTLCSLRYALENARVNGKKRIFYVAPLLTILEQNADEYRKAVGNDSYVLEHHSNIVFDNKKDNSEELKKYELLTENWNAPIIVTTLVQLLNAMFDGSMSSVRRFHALCNSVIIIDEVQSVPLKTLGLFNTAVNFLSEKCNCCILLCSATQPCLEKIEPESIRIKLTEPKDIIPYDETLWEPFKRTEIIDMAQTPNTSDDIADFTYNKLVEKGSILIVCNTKATAHEIYKKLKHLCGDDAYTAHLSASMCKKHREDVMNALKENMKSRPTICVSTQLIEAGVDISFKCVIRMLAGLDNITQAAGRCNRNGESKVPCDVYVLRHRDENLSFLKDIDTAKGACSTLLYEYAKNPAAFDNSLISDKSVYEYYRQYYCEIHSSAKDRFLFPVSDVHSNIYSMLSNNSEFCNVSKNAEIHYMHQSFKTAGKYFSVFDENTRSVIVPYDNTAREIINQIADNKYDLKTLFALLSMSKPYIVSVYEYTYKTLCENGGITEYGDGAIAVLTEGFYDESCGISDVKSGKAFLN